jgi:hypothetical protein
MPRSSFRWAPLLFLATACVGPGAETGVDPLRYDAPPEGIPGEAWTHALAAHRQASLVGHTQSPLLTIIDFTRVATERRLWVVDVVTRQVHLTEFVAHGQHSGGLWPTQFSNREGTNQSSLGTFITASTYIGVRGLSLRLKGVEPGINDNAWSRGIVIHGTPNVSEARARKGTMGRTEGCPAVPTTSARRLIRLIENGVVVFAWYPERGFLSRSEYLDPGAAAMALGSIGN